MSRDFRSLTKKRTLLMFCLGVVSSGFAQAPTAGHAAPAPPRANSQQVQLPSSALCALIDCHKPPKPVITGVDPSSAITPGGQMVVIGTNFNSNDGKPGDIVLTIGSKPVVTRTALAVHAPFSQPYREAHLTTLGWSDGHAYGQLPSNITGVTDGPASIRIVRSDGTASDTFQVQFMAARELRRVFPASDMNTDTCSKNGDENQCNSWADFNDPWSPAGHSVLGLHDKFLQNQGAPESSSDYYSFKVANGWAWDATKDTDNLSYIGCTTDAIVIQIFDFTSTSGKLEFDWKINCSIVYTLEVYINGPIGVPWK